MSDRSRGSGTSVVMPTPDEASAPAAIAQRSEFVRAFVEHAGDPPASERLTVRWPTLITVSALVCLGTLVVGVFWGLLRPMPDAEKEAARRAASGPNGAPSAGAPTTWTAVAGWDCAAATDRGFDAQGRSAGWQTMPSGGWAGDGCHGTFAILPIPDKKENGTPQSANWWFTPPSGMNSCRVSIHVPGAGYPSAKTVRYSMRAGGNGTPYAVFTVNQAENLGKWVDVGSYPVHQNQIAISLDPTDASGARASRVVLGQIRVHCGH
ncbi:hypothetical protein GCM10027280_35330 [Micromonospora polyrhachis]|uniref:Uncharacterized protein n=1 Tax=Micromonospora polyrhachis TaxID=1282883 RepID=A0A7W7WPM8_9ACTN|nr:hypothetical protein [Micromonospora polyrhachis]MBB4958864.1 hypothetical protein [Micromonospora polyrhachis]